jgi:hypothetical protein
VIKAGIARKVRNQNEVGNKPKFMKNGMNRKGKKRNGRIIHAAFCSPYLLIRVFVPTRVSACLSAISFVTEPPNKKHPAIQAMMNGIGSKIDPKTLHDARIPKKPLGIAIQS